MEIGFPHPTTQTDKDGNKLKLEDTDKLHLQIWDKDMKYDDLVGECKIKLSDIEFL